MDYQKLLEYYLTSDEWEYEIIFFFEGWKHHYDPAESMWDQPHGKTYLCSDIFLEFERKLDASGGSFFDLHLSTQQFKTYFNSKYTSHQRFAILFGLWWGLSDNQIQYIANLRQKHICEYWLNYFLCNPDVIQPTLSEKELSQYNYGGKYHTKNTAISV